MTKQVEINATAPDFTLPDFNGNRVKLSEYQGRRLVIIVFNRGFA